MTTQTYARTNSYSMTTESGEPFGPEYWEKVEAQEEPAVVDVAVGTPELPVDVAQLAKAILQNRTD